MNIYILNHEKDSNEILNTVDNYNLINYRFVKEISKVKELDLILVYISDSFLKSELLINEIFTLVKDDKYINKIYPLFKTMKDVFFQTYSYQNYWRENETILNSISCFIEESVQISLNYNNLNSFIRKSKKQNYILTNSTLSNFEIKSNLINNELIELKKMNSISKLKPITGHVPKEQTFRFMHKLSNFSIIENNEFFKIPVFFATDRIEKNGAYHSSRSEVLNYGLSEVLIPKSHERGVVENNIFSTILKIDIGKIIKIQKIQKYSEKEFYSKIASKKKQVKLKEALIFIHGYNVSFKDALKRTAQFAFDLDIEIPILYSWPSKGKIMGYTHDSTNIDLTLIQLIPFLKDIESRLNVDKVHLIAHSMGNRALTKALSEINGSFNNVILTAPDIDKKVFEKLIAPKILKNNSHSNFTLYGAQNDKALQFSNLFNGGARVGETNENVTIIPPIDTIDVTNINKDFLGHSYYGDNKEIMNDIYNVIRNNLLPKNRNLKLINTSKGNYWEFKL